jgi:hypothetical protein
VCLILKEHRYVVEIGDQKYVFRIEELVSGKAIWKEKFRLHIPAESNRSAKTLYGASAAEVAKLGADFVAQGK